MNADQKRALEHGLEGVWPVLGVWVEERVSELTLSLIDRDSDEVRGRIKQLRDLKALPEQLRAEAVGAQVPQKEEGFP